jgi:hypothetical protein
MATSTLAWAGIAINQWPVLKIGATRRFLPKRQSQTKNSHGA